MLSQDDRHPVQCDSWHDAKAFASRHSKKPNNPYRLVNGGKRNHDAIRGYIALRGTSKLMGHTYGYSGRNRTIASASSKSLRARAWAQSH
jgi:hypothetical protein